MSKKRAPWFPFYPSDWLASASVATMTHLERSAYIDLLCHEWNQPDCGLPDDDAQLAALARVTTSQWAKAAPRIRARFSAVDGRLFNDRLVEEKEKQNQWRTKSSEGGQVGSQKRWGGKGGHQMVTECSSIPDNTVVGLRSTVIGHTSSATTKPADADSKNVTESWPKTAEAMRAHFPWVDDRFVLNIVFECAKLDHGIQDYKIAQAVMATYRANQNSPGLWLKTIPDYIRNARLQEPPPSPDRAAPQCEKCGDKGYTGTVQRTTSAGYREALKAGTAELCDCKAGELMRDITDLEVA